MESIKLKEKIVNLEKRLDTIDDDKSKIAKTVTEVKTDLSTQENKYESMNESIKVIN